MVICCARVVYVAAYTGIRHEFARSFNTTVEGELFGGG
jgi:hypothetical protein